MAEKYSNETIWSEVKNRYDCSIFHGNIVKTFHHNIQFKKKTPQRLVTQLILLSTV